MDDAEPSRAVESTLTVRGAGDGAGAVEAVRAVAVGPARRAVGRLRITHEKTCQAKKSCKTKWSAAELNPARACAHLPEVGALAVAAAVARAAVRARHRRHAVLARCKTREAVRRTPTVRLDECDGEGLELASRAQGLRPQLDGGSASMQRKRKLHGVGDTHLDRRSSSASRRCTGRPCRRHHSCRSRPPAAALCRCTSPRQSTVKRKRTG
jgi:hypothetical protein